MTNEYEIAEIERDIAEAKQVRDLADVLTRLDANSDFQRLIGQAYLRDEAIRLVHAKADPGVDPVAVLRDIDAIGTFAGFLRDIRRNGALADKVITDGESMIEQLHSENE